jgi:hypothetical protein
MQFNIDKIYDDFEILYNHLRNVYKIEIEKKLEKVKKRGKDIDEKDVLLEIERLEKLKENNEDIFYDINYSFLDNRRINIILEKNQLVNERKKIEFEKNYSENIPEAKIKELEANIEDIKLEEEKLLNEFKESKKNFGKIDDIYITFKNTEEASVIKNAYKIGKISRCCKIMCCNRKSIQYL